MQQPDSGNIGVETADRWHVLLFINNLCNDVRLTKCVLLINYVYIPYKILTLLSHHMQHDDSGLSFTLSFGNDGEMSRGD